MIRVNDQPSEWEPGLTVAGLLVRQGFAPTIAAVWINDEFVRRVDLRRRRFPTASMSPSC